jgi:hypothetical protein
MKAHGKVKTRPLLSIAAPHQDILLLCIYFLTLLFCPSVRIQRSSSCPEDAGFSLQGDPVSATQLLTGKGR